MYLRHRQIVEYYGHRHQKRRDGGRWRLASDVMLWIGYGSVLGLSLVANFQVSFRRLLQFQDQNLYSVLMSN